MTGSAPPRLAVALLRRFLRDNEPLAGDLLEGFAVRQSRLWFWRQALLAIALGWFQRRDEDRPLGLGGPLPFVPARRDRDTGYSRPVNLTGSPLPGVGGLGLVAFGAMVALVRPAALWMFLPAILGGVALGLTMAIVRRRVVLSGPAGAARTLLRDR